MPAKSKPKKPKKTGRGHMVIHASGRASQTNYAADDSRGFGAPKLRKLLAETRAREEARCQELLDLGRGLERADAFERVFLQFLAYLTSKYGGPSRWQPNVLLSLVDPQVPMAYVLVVSRFRGKDYSTREEAYKTRGESPRACLKAAVAHFLREPVNREDLLQAAAKL